MRLLALIEVNATGVVSKTEGRNPLLLWLLWIIWVPFFTPALFDLYQTPPFWSRLSVILVGVILFFGLYLWTTWRNSQRLFEVGSPRPQVVENWLPLLAMIALSFGLPLLVHRNLGDWLDLFILTSAYIGGCYSPLRAAQLIGVLAVLDFAVGQFLALSWPEQGKALIFVVVVGFVALGLTRFVRISRELQAANEEIARLAVTNERLRIARDLHDLLGHNLALIALKSELARRLIEVAPQRAADELVNVESVARTTLQEVREAVSAYRQPTFARELQGSQEILAAAGISYKYEGDNELINTLPPALDTLLGWVVREGVTNLIKHSQAKECVIRARRSSNKIWLEIKNDGLALPVVSNSSTISSRVGNGLRGLTERVVASGGELTTKNFEGEGGFELVVCVPMGQSKASHKSK